MAPTMLPNRLRALLIGVPLEDGSLDAYRVVELVGERLREMFAGPGHSAAIEALSLPGESTRKNVLETLARWVDEAKDHADAAHLLFFFGHGRRLELQDQLVHALICERGRDNRKRVVFDFELSAQLTRLHRICGNVTVIVDACQSGVTVRGPTQVVAGSARWVKEALAAGPEVALAADSHPDVVRLMGSSPVQRSWAASALIRGRHYPKVGRFTAALLGVLDRAGARWDRLTWELLAHAIRQEVIDERGSESQWVALAGPGERRLFARPIDPEAADHEPTRTVGCLAYAGAYWIRAGAITGVREDDAWALVELLTDDEGRPQLREPWAKVEQVGAGRARLDLRYDPEVEPPPPGHPPAVRLMRVAAPTPVQLEAGVDLGVGPKLERTVWLTRTDADAAHTVRASEGRLALTDRLERWAPRSFADDEGGRAELVELLEDRARAERLLGLEDHAPASSIDSPITWTVGVDRPRGDAQPIRAGDALWVELHNSAVAPRGAEWRELETWFVSVVMIDPLGRPRLLNGSLPEGIELEPQGRACIGKRFGAARGGIVLTWPGGLDPAITRGPVRLLCLSSRRPVQLGHLASTLVGADREALALQGLPERARPEVVRQTGKPAGTRSARSEPPAPAPQNTLAETEGWGFARIDLVLEAGETT